MTSLENLAKCLSRLPGVGPKSAMRMAYSLMKTPQQFNDLLAQNISTIQSKVHQCSICGAYTETDVCEICSDTTRDSSILCIVEQPQDQITIQSSGAYNGLFHILDGAINPINNVGPENLRFESLIKRIKEGHFTEIIIATNPTEEGDITAMYIRRLLEAYPEISLTRLASGLPVGGDLEYADRTTLTRSFRGRIKF